MATELRNIFAKAWNQRLTPPQWGDNVMEFFATDSAPADDQSRELCGKEHTGHIIAKIDSMTLNRFHATAKRSWTCTFPFATLISSVCDKNLFGFRHEVFSSIV